MYVWSIDIVRVTLYKFSYDRCKETEHATRQIDITSECSYVFTKVSVLNPLQSLKDYQINLVVMNLIDFRPKYSTFSHSILLVHTHMYVCTYVLWLYARSICEPNETNITFCIYVMIVYLFALIYSAFSGCVEYIVLMPAQYIACISRYILYSCHALLYIPPV